MTGSAAARQLAFGSYNLENGGLDEGGRRDTRFARQMEMLAEASADVWAFQFGCSSPEGTSDQEFCLISG